MEYVSKQFFNGRALLIEDNINMRAYMQDLLRHWGCQCDAAVSVDDALALARANKPDFLISDYRLNELLNGIEAIVTLRELLGSNIPAMLVTGDVTPEREAEARANNIHLLHKPLSVNELHRGLMMML
jgi:CheY-like chemotaxis protein